MYFKLEANITKFSFVDVIDYIFDKNSGTAIIEDPDFKKEYSLLYFYEKQKMIVSLEVSDAKIEKAHVMASMGLPNKIESILTDRINLDKFIDESHLKKSFWDCSKDIHRELSSYIIRTIDMLRWRFGLDGVNNYFESTDYRFSLDCHDWFNMPFRADPITIFGKSIPHVSSGSVKDVRNLMEIYSKESIEHEMFREAYYNREQNPRSSLIMAVSAAEIGFKKLASELHPQNVWLFEELQSPDLHRMLKDYLPSLPAKLTINGKVFVPKNIRGHVHTAVKTRNKIVHRGVSDFDKTELTYILISIRDLLFLFDYYRGFEWALSNISTLNSKDLFK